MMYFLYEVVVVVSGVVDKRWNEKKNLSEIMTNIRLSNTHITRSINAHTTTTIIHILKLNFALNSFYFYTNNNYAKIIYNNLYFIIVKIINVYIWHWDFYFSLINLYLNTFIV